MNQADIVLRELKRRTRKGITQQDMIKHGVLRLAARVQDLRDRGISIATQYETYINRHGNRVRYGRYFLA